MPRGTSYNGVLQHCRNFLFFFLFTPGDAEFKKKNLIARVSLISYLLCKHEEIKVKVLVSQSPLTLRSHRLQPLPIEFSKARTLKWVSTPFSKESPQPRDQTWVSCIAGRLFTICAAREAPIEEIRTYKSVYLGEKKHRQENPENNEILATQNG